MKSSQTGGTYAFSSSGLVIISEFLKLLLAASLLLRHCRKQSRKHTEESGSGYAPLIPLTSSPKSSSQDELIAMKSDGDDEEDKSSEETLREDIELGIDTPCPRSNLLVLWVAAMREVSVETRYGFANLALLYALINNTVRTHVYPSLPNLLMRMAADLRFVQTRRSGYNCSYQIWSHLHHSICHGHHTSNQDFERAMGSNRHPG
jgi:hypothetical protein